MWRKVFRFVLCCTRRACRARCCNPRRSDHKLCGTPLGRNKHLNKLARAKQTLGATAIDARVCALPQSSYFVEHHPSRLVTPNLHRHTHRHDGATTDHTATIRASCRNPTNTRKHKREHDHDELTAPTAIMARQCLSNFWLLFGRALVFQNSNSICIVFGGGRSSTSAITTASSDFVILNLSQGIKPG